MFRWIKTTTKHLSRIFPHRTADQKHSAPTWLTILAPALQIQIALSLGFLATLLLSTTYWLINDQRFLTEQPWLYLLGLGLSLFAWLLGDWLGQNYHFPRNISLRRGAWVVVIAWLIASLISALVYFLAGLPAPEHTENYTLLQRFTDSLYESLSGFTTAGTSILPTVDNLPRGLLFWRSATHWLGGIGIAYLAILLWRRLLLPRSELINAESESHVQLHFDSEENARKSGQHFLQIYALLTGVLFLLLLASGYLFRLTPYIEWYDGIYEALNFSLSTLSIGGFSIYDTSVGLLQADGSIGGLQNTTSEWIIGLFMFFAGINFGLWYVLIFERSNTKSIWRNTELQTYIAFFLFIIACIWAILWWYQTYDTPIETLRYAFFNVSTVVSTTGLATADFTTWPVSAQGILYICYFIGGCVGSTAGGMKIARYLVAGAYAKLQIRNFLYGSTRQTFTIDGIRYTEHMAGMVMVSLVSFFLIFLIGGILFMITSSTTLLENGERVAMDFTTSFTTSIAHLGNIGPAPALGEINTGPSGNYSGFSLLSKYLMMFLMLLGRLGILTFFMLFLTRRGQKKLSTSVSELDYDSDVVELIR